MMRLMIGHKTCNEVVTVVITFMATRGQRLAGGGMAGTAFGHRPLAERNAIDAMVMTAYSGRPYKKGMTP
jgi:hypothetical protein